MRATDDTCMEHSLPGLGRARLKKGLSIIPDPIYPDEAAHALAIFKQLRIVDAPGSPTFGESCATVVFDLVAACLAPTMRRPVYAISRKFYPYPQEKLEVHAGRGDHDDCTVTELAAGGGLHDSGPDCGGGGQRLQPLPGIWYDVTMIWMTSARYRPISGPSPTE